MLKNPKKIKKSVTLIELILVVIVIGIIATFAVPGYNNARRQAIDREARAILPLIRAAQMTRLAEGRVLVNCTGVGSTACINAGLGLDIPVGGNWNYTTVPILAAGDFCAGAAGTAGTGNWGITRGAWEASAGVHANCR